MKLSKLEKYFVVEKLIFHSLELALYNVSAVVEGKEYMVTDEKGDRLKHYNVIELQKRLSKVKAQQQVLRQTSAYDEMVGGSEKVSNILEVPLGDNKLY
jgi:predicted mannosyl-3-phosphoglycerate phosphatase (HAD superfamily)